MTGFPERNRPRSGLTVWEILVVVLMIGTLAAIAAPLALGQARLAKDDATAADALDLDQAIRSVYDQQGSVTSVTTQDGWHLIDGAQILEASPGVEVVQFIGTSAASWCVELRHPRGEVAKAHGMRALSGVDEVEPGGCAIPASGAA